jgi:formate dehydrogenase iron-sulfur subunit
MAMAAITGFFHYIRVGPNETDDSDEARAADEMAKTRNSPEKKP